MFALKSLPSLKTLYVNLHQEEQVDLIMKTLGDLTYLNGLPVEREIPEDEGEYEDDETMKSRSPVKEEPYEEDQEDDEVMRGRQEYAPENEEENEESFTS